MSLIRIKSCCQLKNRQFWEHKVRILTLRNINVHADSPLQMFRGKKKKKKKSWTEHKNLRTHFHVPNQFRVFNKRWQCFTLLMNGRTFWRIYYKSTILGNVPRLCIRIKCRSILSERSFFRSIQTHYLMNLLGFVQKHSTEQYFYFNQRNVYLGLAEERRR